MSYQVIARKWRPQSFDEVSGQGHVTTALRNAIRSNRIPHAILLTGPRGVGKTTLARLISRCLNCEKGPTDEPCGSCVPCTEITEGRSTDVQEIDAASRTGVDDIREVIESIRYAAAPGKYRIFVIDEVHMLSNSAFNALLKTLEEPPPRSLFIFATTNPEKIPFTVLSRCQRHDLRRIALTSVSERLGEICASEGIEISPSALASIAREGDGSMRDAQTLLDQIVAYGGESISDETVAEVLDLVDRHVLRSIVEACLDSDPKAALEQVGVATSGGSEARRIADALLELLRDLIVLRVAPDSRDLFDGPDEERADLVALGSRTEPARLRRMFRALTREIEDLSWAPNPTAVLEMAVIRLATMPAGDDVGQLLARLDQLERRLSAQTGATPSGGGGSKGAAGSVSDRGPRRRSEAPKNPSPEQDAFDAPPASGASVTDIRLTPRTANPTKPTQTQGPTEPSRPSMPNRTAKPSKPAALAKPQTPSQPSAATTAQDAIHPEVDATTDRLGGGASPEAIFDRLRTKALEKDRARFAILEGARILSLEGDMIELGVAAAFHAERLRTNIADLEALGREIFDRPIRIRVEVNGSGAGRTETSDTRERSRKQRQEALNSEPVNLAIEVLNAEIVEIRPLGEKS